jgi:hemolysin-activating ACP:hemolysin acyltransferase
MQFNKKTNQQPSETTASSDRLWLSGKTLNPFGHFLVSSGHLSRELYGEAQYKILYHVYMHHT